MEEEKRLTQQQLSMVIIGVLVLAGLLVWFLFTTLDKRADDQVLTMEQLTNETKGMNFTYDGFVYHMGKYNTKLIKEGRYSYHFTEEEQSVDPDFNDEYNGFLVNEDANYAIYQLEDGFYFFLYNPDSMYVYVMNEWRGEIGESELLTYEKISEKAEKIKALTKTNDPQEIKNIKNDILKINTELTNLNQKRLE